MDCPRCKIATTSRPHGDVRIDACERCGGMFLDQGELNRIAEPTSGDLEYSTVHQDSFEHSDRYWSIVCPCCGAAEMKKVEFNIYTGIILDYCPGCRGFWLDGPELGRINQEVRSLDDSAGEEPRPGMLWFAQFIWSLPK